MKYLYILTVLLLFGCHEKDETTVDYHGNKKIITHKHKGNFKFVENSTTYVKCDIIKIRIDDESEYHITYQRNGYSIELEHDLDEWYVTLRNGTGQSWVTDYHQGNIKFHIFYPTDKIEYFED